MSITLLAKLITNLHQTYSFWFSTLLGGQHKRHPRGYLFYLKERQKPVTPPPRRHLVGWFWFINPTKRRKKKMMNSIILHLVVGIVAGFALGLVLGIGVVCCLRIRRRRCTRIQSPRSISAQREKAPKLPVKGVSNNGVDSSNTNTTVSEFSNFGQDSPRTSEWTNMPLWLEGLRRKSVVSACGIPKYSFRSV